MGAVPAGSQAQLHVVFLAILPRIERHGHVYFCGKNPELREELIAEMVAICWSRFLRLMQRGKGPTTFASALAGYAARSVSLGRRLCGQEKAKDVLSPLAQRMYGFTVGKLPDLGMLSDNPLHDALHDNTQSPPPDAAAFRCDFPLWMNSQPERDRQLVLDLMAGEKTLDVARRFGLSAGRVSQKRREFHEDWRRFQGEPTPAAV